MLWPLFHYLIGQLPLEVEGYELYEAINRRFAEAAVAAYRPGDMVWVHDYQLMLVPQMIRERLPEAAIGYFHHIPFPSSDVFRTLPFRDQLLRGLLGADVIGFHTAGYVGNFASAALLRLGVSTDVDRLRWDNRTVRIGVFPMGVDAAAFDRLSRTPELLAEVEALRHPADVRLLVGIDRLDYTKGIPRRLLAFERLLRDHPEMRGRVRFIQVAVPSRQNVDAYQEYRRQVDAIVGRIHGAFATPNWAPVHYIYRASRARSGRAVPRRRRDARHADPRRHEPRRQGVRRLRAVDEDGVLVLSEFAGAAASWPRRCTSIPFDIDGDGRGVHRALAMPREERADADARAARARLRYDVQRWAAPFLTCSRNARRARRAACALSA